ncbi:MAG: class I SAM-dependent methyltransferase [Dehalococcoidia bacterium]
MPQDTDTSEERLAFDKVVETYDRVRPTYPEPLFDELFSRFEAPPIRILESGAGTGKATGSLLRRGAHVTAVEPGLNMVAFLRERLGDEYGESLQAINSTFEDVSLQGGFDLVFAATSFHWVDPAVRLQKAHDLLRSGGAIAIVSTNQIRSDTDRGYFAHSQSVYKRYFPDEEVPALPGEDIVPPEFTEIDASDLFGTAELHRYRWDQTYPTADYADLMRSYAGMQMMADNERESLIAELSELIEREYGGSVTRPLVITLTLAFRP